MGGCKEGNAKLKTIGGRQKPMYLMTYSQQARIVKMAIMKLAVLI